MNDQENLLDLERRRCAAIGDVDIDALKEILVHDYVHVHATGKIDSLSGHLDAIQTRPRKTERRNLQVRIYGDAAVLIGEQINLAEGLESVAIVQQVAIKQNERWRFVSTQVTRKA